MTVTLLRYTPDPDLMVALAARRCYSNRAADDIEKGFKPEEVERMINLLFQRGHYSVFEHASFTFSADGISRALSHQLVRHRIASYSQESQRYVNYLKLKEIPNIIPPKISANPKTLEIYNKAMEESLNAYRKMVEMGVAPEDARYIFPNAVETKIVFTMNARSLFNFFEQRCCMKAQWEIRQLAYEMLASVKKVAPLLFKSAGAPCQFAKNPYCREDDTKCPMYQAMQKRLSESDKV